MRIRVEGDNETARMTQMALARAGFAVGKAWLFQYVIVIQEDPKATHVEFDSVDSLLERCALNFVSELSPSGKVLVKRAGGNQDPRQLHITVPANDREREAVSVGVMRAFLAEVGL